MAYEWSHAVWDRWNTRISLCAPLTHRNSEISVCEWGSHAGIIEFPCVGGHTEEKVCVRLTHYMFVR